ncbi:mannosyl-3-phosphoglycerate phosphatase [Yoonia maritima]|uniref:Mannosyl-3-phosphoglycerate phosphatase n=1 Tax=Yoonia maritima TaxID=1435347 RepID=A0A2T0VYK0_9RHOB|nr:HAD-IIB family hydrolase [Yoonia maritima]PRY77294.1 mannosyl-3-phosphoglycerate phosphatase [Yoonia maritima]
MTNTVAGAVVVRACTEWKCCACEKNFVQRVASRRPTYEPAIMNACNSLVVFSDLDGTLLDHHTYSWSAAWPALDLLRRINAPLVLSSSKTAVEIAEIQADLGIVGTPAIVENGAGLLTDQPDDAGTYAQLLDVLNGLPDDLRQGFEGFGDMDVERVSEITGLDAAGAKAAKARAFSEPGLWSGTDDGRVKFIAGLAARGVSAREGGRFLTLSFGATKADGMAQIVARLKPHHTIALGDAPNDVEMLNAADFGVIVANPTRQPLPQLPGESTGRIFRTTLPGPAGWNEAVLRLVEQLGLH